MVPGNRRESCWGDVVVGVKERADEERAEIRSVINEIYDGVREQVVNATN